MNDRLLKYSRFFLDPSAMWHIHTTHTDGKCTVSEVFDIAKKDGLQFICFIEHIRSKPSYEPDAFIQEVKALSTSTGVCSLVGFEAKLLSDGSVDLPEMPSETLVFLAEHGIPCENKDEYLSTLIKGLSQSVVSGWVHPGLLAMKMGWKFSRSDAQKIATVLRERDLVYEINKKYGLPPSELSAALSDAQLPFFVGLDFHHPDDVNRRGSTKADIHRS